MFKLFGDILCDIVANSVAEIYEDDHASANFDQFRVVSVEFGPSFAKGWPIVGQMLALSADFGPTSTNFGPNWTTLRRLRPDLGPMWPNVGHCCAMSAECGANSNFLNPCNSYGILGVPDFLGLSTRPISPRSPRCP